MFNLSFKNAFRFLLKHKLFSILNIVGLTIGITTCWVLLSIIRYEFSFESAIPERENIYKLITGRVFNEEETYYGGVSAPIYQAVRENISEVEIAVPVFNRRISSVKINETIGITEFELPENVIATDDSYFKLVPYQWIAGNKENPFQNPESVVLTKSRANQYFKTIPIKDIIGKTITYNDTIIKEVTGIVEDLNFPTEFSAQEIIYLKPKVFELVEWTNTNGGDKLYLKINNQQNTESVLNQIEKITNQKWIEHKTEKNLTFELKRWFNLLPLKDAHFATYVKENIVSKTNKKVLIGLIGIAIFIVLLACINYINISTAQLPQRGKEIGVRKTLGSSNKNIILQLMLETTIIVMIAAFCSIGLSKICFWALAGSFPIEAVNFQFQFNTILILSFILLSTIVISGIYPAIQAIKINPIESIKNGFSKKTGNNKLSLRKALFVFQFTIAQCFIIGAIIVGQQLQYTLKKDLGFDKDAVLLINLPFSMLEKNEFKNREKTVIDELKKLTSIKDISYSEAPLTNNYSSSPYTLVSDKENIPTNQQLNRKIVDENYLNFYKIDLLEGTNFKKNDSSLQVILNETAVKTLGIPSVEMAVGNFIKGNNQIYHVIGVVKDFHLQNFYEEIEPLILFSHHDSYNTINIKLSNNSNQWQKDIESIKGVWNKFYPSKYFNASFYDEQIETFYKEEKKLSILINSATIISIVIGCMGLFGLATLTAFQRTKEIGVRKVLGASVKNIVTLLTIDFIKLVFIAVLIATPIAWWLMNKWLEEFVYKVSVTVWTFLFAGTLAIIITIITVSGQALKAAIVNPVDSLRNE